MVCEEKSGLVQEGAMGGVAVATVRLTSRWNLACDGSGKQINCPLYEGEGKGGSVGRGDVGFGDGGPCCGHPPTRLDRYAVHGRKDLVPAQAPSRTS